MGYEGLLEAMRTHGFFPDKEDLYFETPFSKTGYSNYTYEAAAEEAVLAGRVHEICREGTAGPWRRPHYTNCFEVRTIVLRDVPNFNDLFEYYQSEWEYLDSIGYDRIWKRQVLESGSYYEFVERLNDRRASKQENALGWRGTWVSASVPTRYDSREQATFLKGTRRRTS